MAGDAGDRLDATLDAGQHVVRPGRRWPSLRLALGLSPAPRSGLLLLLVGIALGPYGLRLLSDPVLASLDPAVSAALVALGVLVGLDVKVGTPGEVRLLGGASLDAGITVLVVAIGMAVVLAWSPIAEPMPWLFALMLGICAAPSSTPGDTGEEARGSLAARIGDLDDVLPIALSMLVVVWARPETPAAYASLLGQSSLLTVMIASAVWLLVRKTSSEHEQRVFVIGGLLLLGGGAAHLSLSAPFAGLVAGVFWSVIGGPAREYVARDVRALQHPLTVLLLVVAGARLAFSSALAGVVLGYVVLRIAGKLVGGWFAARVTREPPSGLGSSLSAPGVAGIAIALNVLQARGDAGVIVFAIVVAGWFSGELLSLLVGPRQEGQP